MRRKRIQREVEAVNRGEFVVLWTTNLSNSTTIPRKLLKNGFSLGPLSLVDFLYDTINCHYSNEEKKRTGKICQFRGAATFVLNSHTCLSKNEWVSHGSSKHHGRHLDASHLASTLCRRPGCGQGRAGSQKLWVEQERWGWEQGSHQAVRRPQNALERAHTCVPAQTMAFRSLSQRECLQHIAIHPRNNKDQERMAAPSVQRKAFDLSLNLISRFSHQRRKH